MSSRPVDPPERNTPGANLAQLETRLQRAAAAFPYPSTPDLAADERRRLAAVTRPNKQRRAGRLTLGLGFLLLLIMATMLVSPVRARVLDWLRVGAVRIFFLPSPTPLAPEPSGTPRPEPTTMPTITPTYLQSVLDLAGETSLEQAQEAVNFPILLPTYPADLGQPDRVYLQRINRLAVFLVWMDPAQPDRVLMALSETSSESILFEKYQPKSMLDTQVGGQEAVWIEGEYPVVVRDGEITMIRLVNQGHTLIWNTGGLTFRLETDADLETAIQIAESIR